MIKIATKLKDVEKFETKEEAIEWIERRITEHNIDDNECYDLCQAKREIEAGATRIVLNGRFNFSPVYKDGEAICDYAKYLLAYEKNDIPSGFFDVHHFIIKALVLGKIYEFTTKKEADEELSKLIPEIIDYDEKHNQNSKNHFEIERLLINIRLIHEGALRVVDMNSDIPEGFYEIEPITCEVTKIAMWRYIEIYVKRKDAAEDLFEMKFYSDYKDEEKIIDRAIDEFNAGNKRIVFQDPCVIPRDFFDEEHTTTKILFLGDVFEFETKKDAIEKLNEMIHFFGTYGYFRNKEIARCKFNIELIEKGAPRVVDWRSKIPDGFYD